jgi:hypothetical protein
MVQRAKPKRKSARRSKVATPTSSQPESESHAARSITEIRRELLLDHIHDRIDQLCVRLDALGSRIDSQQTRFDTRLLMIEAELKELPRMIESGMRAALKEEGEGNS